MKSRELEIDEALDAVEEALSHLNEASRLLKSASNWGLFDMFGGGGFVTLFKHSKMQAADRELRASQKAIARMVEELKDVDGTFSMGPDVGGLLTAADIIFDNVFVDMMVQQKIAEARQRAQMAIEQCETVRDNLLALKGREAEAGGLPGAE